MLTMLREFSLPFKELYACVCLVGWRFSSSWMDLRCCIRRSGNKEIRKKEANQEEVRNQQP